MRRERIGLSWKSRCDAIDVYEDGNSVRYVDVWLATNDYIHGTRMRIHFNGAVERITVRPDEGDEVILVKYAIGVTK